MDRFSEKEGGKEERKRIGLKNDVGWRRNEFRKRKEGITNRGKKRS